MSTPDPWELTKAEHLALAEAHDRLYGNWGKAAMAFATGWIGTLVFENRIPRKALIVLAPVVSVGMAGCLMKASDEKSRASTHRWDAVVGHCKDSPFSGLKNWKE